MKTLAKFFLYSSWVMLSCLTAGCTSEVETTGGIPEIPENPQANDPNRRSVVISLQNKLILVNGTPESRATTRDGIAEDDENRIESFDIYAFGSDKEEGPYTFQEHFAYRADAGSLPAGASPLELKADEAAGKVNVVFYPRKGLYTKFYCVANQTGMYDAAGNAYTDYTPLQQISQPQTGIPGDAVTVAGTPTENDFQKMNSPLVVPAGFDQSILLTPLPMSGANSQPTDLREYSMGTYVRLNISLIRAVARFDVVNNATKSHFTITDIAMGNGRKGVTLFPIRPIGDVPATTGQLITYPYRPFDGLNANAGTTTKAFYCYPCKAADAGFLILKGLYAVNLTDEKKEVSYRIPFERVTDGNGMRIEINHNHRYTVQITEADPFELTANIRLVDWETGDYIDDYEPDNGLETIAVADLLPAGETTYDIGTNIVTLALKTGSSFTVSTGSNAGVETKLTYYGGDSADGWLKLEEIPVTTTRAGATQQVQYKVSFNESYTGNSYPRGILRLTDKAGAAEEVILIDATFGIPAVTSAGEMNPAGVNNWEETESTLYLVQQTGANTSTGKITVTSIGGSEIVLPTNSGITVSPASSVSTTQEYTFQWSGTDAIDLTEKEFTVTLKNHSAPAKTGNITVKLLPNRINNLALSTAGDGISLTEITNTTAKLTMPIIKDRQFTLTMDAYSKPAVSKCPAWLETQPTTRATPTSPTVSFTFKLKEDATDYNDTELTFTTAKGTGMTVNITREFVASVVSAAGAMSPGANNWDEAEQTLYLTQNSAAASTAELTLYSLGGSQVEIPAGSGFSATAGAYQSGKQTFTFSWPANTSTTLTEQEVIVTLKNSSQTSKTATIKVKLLPNRINNLTLTNQGAGISHSNVTATTASLTMPIIKDRQFTLTMDAYSKPTVSKCPAWLENTTPATRSTPESKTVNFTFKLKEDAANFNDTQLVFTNAAGGTGMTVNITREFQTPTVTAVSMDPSINSYSNKSLKLYQLKSSYYSTATLKVYSLGGSKLDFPANMTADLTQTTAKEQNYVIKYSASDFSLTDVNGGTLYVKNSSDETKKEAIAVTFKSSLPTVTSNRDGQGITYNRTASEIDTYISENLGTACETGFTFTFTSPVGYNFTSISTSNAQNYTQISTGSQSGSSGSIKNPFTLSFKSSATFSNNPNLYYYKFTAKDNRFPDYQIDLYMEIPVLKGKTACKLNGHWAIPYTGTWQQAVDAGNSAGDGWRLAIMWDYRILVGWTGSAYDDYDNYTQRTLNANEAYIKKVFILDKRHWSSETVTNDGSGEYARVLDVYTSTTGAYGRPLKTEQQAYVLVRNQ